MREDEPLRARKYGRRRAALQALKSGRAWDEFVARLVRELKTAHLPDAKTLAARLLAANDPATRSAALGAALAALDQHDRVARDRDEPR